MSDVLGDNFFEVLIKYWLIEKYERPNNFAPTTFQTYGTEEVRACLARTYPDVVSYNRSEGSIGNVLIVQAFFFRLTPFAKPVLVGIHDHETKRIVIMIATGKIRRSSFDVSMDLCSMNTLSVRAAMSLLCPPTRFGSNFSTKSLRPVHRRFPPEQPNHRRTSWPTFGSRTDS